MATRKTIKKTATRAKPAARSAKPSSRATGAAHKLVQAGLGAAERLQSEAVRVYEAIARETERLGEMTVETAQALGKKASVFAREGQKVQAEAQAAAEAKARDVAREVKAFANRSEKSLKRNMQGAVNSTAAGAREGITRLEHVFEERVARTLNTFGIPSGRDVRELQTRMAELQKALNQLNKRGTHA